MSDVFANGRTIVHSGDGGTNTCAAPDVCKTPSPGGPVPVPYVNVARNSDLAEGSTSVTIDGNPVALKTSKLGTSSGDEAGTAGGGLVSAKTKGKMTWGTYSLDVKFEGKGVVRFMDVTQHNGNTFNTAFMQDGQCGFAYGDDPVGAGCPRACGHEKAEHRILERPESTALAVKLMGTLDHISMTPKLSHLAVFKKKGGYMLGVLVCACRQKIYAAMSGDDQALDGFKKAVELLNEHDARKRWGVCDPVDFSQVQDSMGLIPDGQALFLEALPAPRNPPGACAAPKLIQKAHQDGHKPGAMTEVFYFPEAAVERANKKSKVGVRTTVGVTYFKTLGQETRQVTEEFRHGDVVPSCETCQIHLTPMLCPPHKPCPEEAAS
ncbi:MULTISPECIES: DUF4150 domain-containing protein [Myxococcus]|uniref:DUF4150 domain-containing protein n=1 Tax=Myxococcus TaxID=32 RepID=UPI0013D1181D|nr:MULTISPECIES: DUF4150 domain-containing protein [Myxococcus]NVJ24470.1 DUF4150 domain-containing protein [Myxococcus sp. AM011]